MDKYSYQHTSNAYKYDDINYEYKSTTPQKTTARRRVVKASARKAAVKVMAAVIFIAVLLLLQCERIARQNEMINAKKEELDCVNAQIVKVEMNLESMVDLTNIEEIATDRLGLQRPQKNQVIYVNYHGSSRGEVLKDENAGVGGIWHKTQAILQYLY